MPLRAVTHTELDLTRPHEFADVLGAFAREATDRPGVVINAAAYTAVDRAEDEPQLAEAVNGIGAGELAASAREHGLGFIQISTDYVFGGGYIGRERAASHTSFEVDDVTGPLSVYGASKRAGEVAVSRAYPDASVVRTSWVFTGDGVRPDFVSAIAAVAQAGKPLEVVDDQTGTPTYAADLADALLELAARESFPPVLHATNAGATTRFGQAQAVVEQLGLDPAIVTAVPTDRARHGARRPSYSVLSSRSWSEAGLTPLRPWRAALDAALASRQLR